MGRDGLNTTVSCGLYELQCLCEEALAKTDNNRLGELFLPVPAGSIRSEFDVFCDAAVSCIDNLPEVVGDSIGENKATDKRKARQNPYEEEADMFRSFRM